MIIEAMKQALEALEWNTANRDDDNQKRHDAITALRQAIEQAIEQAKKQSHNDHPMRHWDRTCPACLAEKQEPVEESANSTKPVGESETAKSWGQEPVAWQNKELPDEFYEYEQLDPMWHFMYRPLYTAPPKQEWVGLTDDEKLDVIAYQPHPMMDKKWIINAVEAKLKERNT